MRLEDLAGSLDVDSSQAALLIKSWFNPDDIVVLSGKRVIRVVGGVNVMSQCMTARELVNDLTDDAMASLCTDPVPMDVYVNVGSPRDCLDKFFQRVTERDLDYVIGVVGDFDVKEGSFDSTETILNFLSTLALQPRIIVESGSGGVHAWWKFSEKVPQAFGKDIATRWWAYLQTSAKAFCGADVDKLVDTARMLRLPGTVHWPRNGAGATGSVRLRSADGPEYTPTAFLSASEDAWALRNAKVSATRDRDRALTVSTEQFTAAARGEGRWASLFAVAGVEDYFTQVVPWENVLAPAGWTFTRTDSIGRDEWARPGREGEKSACVNWEESPNVMSLLSTSHETGMLDLLDAEIPLTKWRVSLRLNFKDDYQAMVNWTLDLMRRGNNGN